MKPAPAPPKPTPAVDPTPKAVDPIEPDPEKLVRAGKDIDFGQSARMVFDSDATGSMGRARTGLGYDWHAWHIFVAMGPAALAYGLVRWIDSTGEREEWERNMKERKAAAGDGGVMDGFAARGLRNGSSNDGSSSGTPMEVDELRAKLDEIRAALPVLEEELKRREGEKATEKRDDSADDEPTNVTKETAGDDASTSSPAPSPSPSGWLTGWSRGGKDKDSAAATPTPPRVSDAEPEPAAEKTDEVRPAAPRPASSSSRFGSFLERVRATYGRARDALEAAETCEIALRGMSSEELREAKDAPHGWAIASAMKALGHVERLTPSGSSERALELYERAAEYAKDVALSEHPGAMASRMIAEDLQADCALARAQAYAALGDVENAETFAARAVSAAEALGDEKHPRVGAAIAVSGDVYVAKALRSMSNDEKTSLGDGAGVMFAEGLYKSAIKLMHYPHVVEDGKIVLDYEARHLCALLHARYSSILRASGGQREREANAWLESAKILWPDERGDDEGVDGVDIVTKAATKLGVKHGPSVLIDLQQMAPLTMGA